MSDRPIIFSAPMVRALLDGRKTQTRRLAWRDRAHRVGQSPAPSPWQSVRPGERLWVRETCRAEELSRPPQVRAATREERRVLHRTQVVVLDDMDGADGVRYAADDKWVKIENTDAAGNAWVELFHYRGRGAGGVGNLVPALHMPRWASRLTLHVEAVRVERLQDISEDDAQAEGMSRVEYEDCDGDPRLDGVRYIAKAWHADPSKLRTEADAMSGAAFARGAFLALWNSFHGDGAWQRNPEVVVITFRVERSNIDREARDA